MTGSLGDDWVLSEVNDPSGRRVGFLRKRVMADALPEARHRRRAWLTLRYVPEPNQMPSKADLEVFQRIEDELTAKLEEDRLGDLVAVVTLAGKRDHLIYFSEEEQVVKTVAAVMRPFAKYRPEVEISDDPNWDELRNMMG